MHVAFAVFYLKNDVTVRTMTVTVSSTRLINVQMTKSAPLEDALCLVSQENVVEQGKDALKEAAYRPVQPLTVPLGVNAVMVNAGIHVTGSHANQVRFVWAVIV